MTPAAAPPLKRVRALLDAVRLEEAGALLAACDPASDIPPPGVRPRGYWRDCATALRDAGRFDAALRAWQRARDSGLDPAVAELEAAAVRLLSGDFPAALRLLEPLSAAAPKNAAAANLLALALFEGGRPQDALAIWNALPRYSSHGCPLSTHPFHLALGALAIEGFLRRQPPAAEPPLPATGPAPGKSRGRRLRAIEKAIDRGDCARALAWIDAEPPPDSDARDALCQLKAAALGELDLWNRARRELASGLAQAEPDPFLQSFFGYSLVRCGEPEAAIAVLEGVQPAGPDDFFVHYFLGAAEAARGNRPRAALWFQQAFRRFFFDNYHLLLLPAWKKAAAVAAA